MDDIKAPALFVIVTSIFIREAYVGMRTTLTLDEDLARELQERAHRPRSSNYRLSHKARRVNALGAARTDCKSPALREVLC